MTDIIAQALAQKLALLPFVTAYGLVRIVEETRQEGDNARLIRYPVPITLPEADCAGPLQLLPNGKASAAFWFEDEGTVPGGTTDYRQFTATLRLVGWLNTARLSTPTPYATLLGAIVRQMEGVLVVEGLGGVRVKAANLAPGDGATLLSRYTLTDETRPLLRAPFVFFGVTLKATGFLLGADCATLPTVDPAPVC